MIVQCAYCKFHYDSENSWGQCPHVSFDENVTTGTIVVWYGEDTVFLKVGMFPRYALTPAEARTLAYGLLQKADQAEGKEQVKQ